MIIKPNNLEKMITKEEFKKEVLDFAENRPKNWRYGQAVFNYIDQEYGVARYVQFENGTDCFYVDDRTDEFIDKAYEALEKFNNEENNLVKDGE